MTVCPSNEICCNIIHHIVVSGYRFTLWLFFLEYGKQSKFLIDFSLIPFSQGRFFGPLCHKVLRKTSFIDEIWNFSIIEIQDDWLSEFK